MLQTHIIYLAICFSRFTSIITKLVVHILENVNLYVIAAKTNNLIKNNYKDEKTEPFN